MLGVLPPRERGDDAYLRSNPVMVELLDQAVRDVREGRYVIGSIELRARLERYERDLE